MNKQELERELSQHLGISQRVVRETLDVLIEEIILILEEGNYYSQTGFGSFKTELLGERVSYNPYLKKRMRLPVRKKVKFRTSVILKEKINE